MRSLYILSFSIPPSAGIYMDVGGPKLVFLFLIGALCLALTGAYVLFLRIRRENVFGELEYPGLIYDAKKNEWRASVRLKI